MQKTTKTAGFTTVTFECHRCRCREASEQPIGFSQRALIDAWAWTITSGFLTCPKCNKIAR